MIGVKSIGDPACSQDVIGGSLKKGNKVSHV